jgi:hypothetical protein
MGRHQRRRPSHRQRVRVGTSIFAMVVLERPLARWHHEIDVVTTPAGDPWRWCNCSNNGFLRDRTPGRDSSAEFAARLGHPARTTKLFGYLFQRRAGRRARRLVACSPTNYLAGEPITGPGRGPAARRPHPRNSRLTLANFARSLI